MLAGLLEDSSIGLFQVLQGFALGHRLCLAAIVQGVYKRGLDGNASSETAKSYGDRARVLAELGWSLVKGRA